MSIQYILPFDFYLAMYYLGQSDGSGTLYSNDSYVYYIASWPTNETEYLANMVWNDDRVMPSWASVISTGQALYEDFYYSQPADFQDIVDLKTVEDAATTAAIAAVPAQIQPDWNASSGLGKILNKPTIPANQVQTDWNATSGLGKLLNKPTLATVATSGSYADLSSKPSLATVATSGAYSDLTGKPTLSVSYEGTAQRTSSFPIFKSANVSSNVAVFNLTNDGTSTGTTLFPTGVIQDSIQLIVNDATAAYQMSWAFSNSNKTITVTANKLTTANILTGVLGQAAANTAVIKLSIWGY